jgi:acyl-CoA synthetase (AMP-forming)/AMP-acid ligase II
MRESKCTGFAGVPSHYQILLRRSTLARNDVPSLRYLQQAGGHLAPIFINEMRRALPQVSLFVMYGQTEATARLAYLDPSLVGNKPGTIGRAIPGVTLRVEAAGGRDASIGEVGEIVAAGQNIAAGYWNDPEATAQCFRNGKLYTGDLATVDAEGFITVVDRAKDIIKCGGRRISCRDIEDKLLECEDVLEAAVVAMPDPVLGEAVKAIVVPKQRRDNGVEARVLAFCRQRLPFQVVPRVIVVARELPKNSAGKVLKSLLKSEAVMSACSGDAAESASRLS